MVFGLSMMVGGSGSRLLLVYHLLEDTFDHLNSEWSHQGRCSLRKPSEFPPATFRSSALKSREIIIFRHPADAPKCYHKIRPDRMLIKSISCNYFRPNFRLRLSLLNLRGLSQGLMIFYKNIDG